MAKSCPTAAGVPTVSALARFPPAQAATIAAAAACGLVWRATGKPVVVVVLFGTVVEVVELGGLDEGVEEHPAASAATPIAARAVAIGLVPHRLVIKEMMRQSALIWGITGARAST